MRLRTQIDDALAASSSPHAVPFETDPDAIEACADRVERAARDLSVALREVAEEKRKAALKTAVPGGQARSHFGAWDSGDERSADNERIDLDLAREYESPSTS